MTLDVPLSSQASCQRLSAVWSWAGRIFFSESCCLLLLLEKRLMRALSVNHKINVPHNQKNMLKDSKMLCRAEGNCRVWL